MRLATREAAVDDWLPATGAFYLIEKPGDYARLSRLTQSCFSLAMLRVQLNNETANRELAS
jgi:hypothetical protein